MVKEEVVEGEEALVDVHQEEGTYIIPQVFTNMCCSRRVVRASRMFWRREVVLLERKVVKEKRRELDGSVFRSKSRSLPRKGGGGSYSSSNYSSSPSNSSNSYSSPPYSSSSSDYSSTSSTTPSSSILDTPSTLSSATGSSSSSRLSSLFSPSTHSSPNHSSDSSASHRPSSSSSSLSDDDAWEFTINLNRTSPAERGSVSSVAYSGTIKKIDIKTSQASRSSGSNIMEKWVKDILPRKGEVVLDREAHLLLAFLLPVLLFALLCGVVALHLLLVEVLFLLHRGVVVHLRLAQEAALLAFAL